MVNSTTLSLNFLKLLAHDVRWQLLEALAESDRRVQELVEILKRPQNLISYHLRLLREGQIVHERRSSSDGRDVYYSLDLDHLRSLYLESGQTLHLALASFDSHLSHATNSGNGPKPPSRILFLCTHNSARSQLAEGILQTAGGDKVKVFSAGNEPGQVHPLAIQAAAEMGIDITHQQSKEMDQFSGQSFDYIITVCDRVREVCPVYPGDQKQIHWSIADPTEAEGNEVRRLQAFTQMARELSTRINYLLLMIDRQGDLS